MTRRHAALFLSLSALAWPRLATAICPAPLTYVGAPEITNVDAVAVLWVWASTPLRRPISLAT